ncbi:dipeptidyl peptidase 3-like [Pollicipes pollicipes]|uniref:dipeptidyl peptidase 3-like n=1 Tax=Pollicipes pollicipes TaxID=41117 RepID=UPI0018851150|nr:dipeptidyl peptidase 3-like [Pollicipes pollicipes]
MASKYILPNNQPFSRLECEVAFKGLSKKEQLYAHHIAQASWKGGLIVLLQTSPESPLIFVLLHRVFRQQSCEELKQVAFDKCNFSEDDWKAFLVYSSSIYSDMGNYRDFGDTKKVPGLAQEKLAALIRASRAYEQDSKTLERLLDGCLARLYVLNDNVAQLGLGDKGITTYFSANCTDEDAEKAKEYMKHKGVPGRQFSVARGDYSGLLAMVVEELKEAIGRRLLPAPRGYLAPDEPSLTPAASVRAAPSEQCHGEWPAL